MGAKKAVLISSILILFLFPTTLAISSCPVGKEVFCVEDFVYSCAGNTPEAIKHCPNGCEGDGCSEIGTTVSPHSNKEPLSESGELAEEQDYFLLTMFGFITLFAVVIIILYLRM